MSSLTSLWKQDQSNLGDIDVAAIRGRASRFARKIRRRNIVELAACALVLVTIVPSIFLDGPRELVPGMVAMAVGVLVVGAMLLSRGRNREAPPPTAPTREVIEHERSELTRQAQLLERVRWWYLGPLVPGVLLTMWGGLYSGFLHGRYEGANARYAITMTVLVHIVVLGGFVFLDWLNRRVARTLREKAEKLGAEGSS